MLVTVGYDSVALVLSSKLVNQVNQEGGGGGVGVGKARVVVKPCFSTSFNKIKACGLNYEKCVFMCYFTNRAQKVNSRGFYPKSC